MITFWSKRLVLCETNQWDARYVRRFASKSACVVEQDGSLIASISGAGLGSKTGEICTPSGRFEIHGNEMRCRNELVACYQVVSPGIKPSVEFIRWEDNAFYKLTSKWLVSSSLRLVRDQKIEAEFTSNLLGTRYTARLSLKLPTEMALLAFWTILIQQVFVA